MTPADLHRDIVSLCPVIYPRGERFLGTGDRNPTHPFIRAVLAACALHAAALGWAAMRGDFPDAPSFAEPPIAELVFAPSPPAEPEPVAEAPALAEAAAPASLPADLAPPAEPEPPPPLAAVPPIAPPAEQIPEPTATPEPVPVEAVLPMPPPPVPPTPRPQLRPAPRMIAARAAAAGSRQLSDPLAQSQSNASASLPPHEEAVSSRSAVEAMASLESRIRGAVQAAVHFPPAAQMMGLTGRAQVFLEYRAGAVGNLNLARSAGTPLFDEAALSAVRSASYPKPPPEIGDRLLRLLVWVEFKHQG